MDAPPHACNGRGWCAVLHAAQRISHKWQPVVVHRLLDGGPLGFRDLEADIDGISAKVLTESLRTLEADLLVRREVLSESPLRVQYHLTPAGHDLAPVVQAMEAWGRRHVCTR